MARSQRLLFAFGLVTSWRMSTADDSSGSSGFQWKWANNMVSTQLTQCEGYGVQVLASPNNSSAFGTPPYYMIAWKANGIPTVSDIGSDRDNLSWTVNQASGSSLILTVADSNQKAGGEAPSLYNVTDGDSSCLPPPPSTNITLVANLSTSDPLETCEPLGLRVYGGQSPYTISIEAVGSSVVTNVTLDKGNDVLTWPNLADPNGQLMVSVSDANGTWGTSTGIFKTAGDAVTNDTRCAVVTNQGNSANIDQHPPQASGSNNTALIAGIVVPVVVVCLLAILAFFLWRRRKQAKSREAEPAFLPEAWVGPSLTETGPDGASATYSPYDPPANSKLARYRDEVNSHSRTPSSQQGILMGHLTPGSSGTPRQATFEGHSGPGSATGSRSQDGSGKGGQRLPPGVSPDWTVEPDIIIQHRDGGTVQEIPPPYPSFAAPAEPSSAPIAAVPTPPTSAGLSVADSSAGVSSRPSSSAGPSTSSSAPLNPGPPGPPSNKGKSRETDLLS
ncbi:hypothetical protein ACEPAF_2004 [Sanghuangporus sanghuang]